MSSETSKPTGATSTARLSFVVLAVCVVVAGIWLSIARVRSGSGHPAGSGQRAATWSITGSPVTMDRDIGAVAVGGHVLVTGDGGATFTTTTPPPLGTVDSLPYAFYLTTTTGWVGTTQSSATTSPSSIVTIWRTVDAGRSWQNVHLPAFSVPSAHVAGFYFLDAQRGWMSVSLQSGMQHNPGALFKTADGGATWTTLSLPYAGQVSFLNATTGWLIGSRVPTTGIYELSITHDGGQTWQSVNLPVPAPAGYQPLSVSIGAPMLFTTDDGAIPVGYGTMVQMDLTRDGGATWTAGPSFTLPSGADTTRLATASAGRAGYVSAAGKLFRTQDAGQTWTQVQAANFDGASMLRFVSPTTGWAYAFGGTCVGAKGSQTCVRTWSLQRTTDAGATWKTTFTQTLPY
jgi:photosystem II stability/assembly factor-like uncharacterized protein